MNFTMVIADDEPLVLKSLEMLVAKNFPNIQVAGLAENGVELKELLERAGAGSGGGGHTDAGIVRDRGD